MRICRFAYGDDEKKESALRVEVVYCECVQEGVEDLDEDSEVVWNELVVCFGLRDYVSFKEVLVEDVVVYAGLNGVEVLRRYWGWTC